MRTYYTYMLASKAYGTLYIGVTNGLIARVEQHRSGEGSAFTKRHDVTKLVWFEMFERIKDAIQKEKTMKEWPRQWKINLIEAGNPNWIDLYPSLPGAKITAD